MDIPDRVRMPQLFIPSTYGLDLGLAHSTMVGQNQLTLARRLPSPREHNMSYMVFFPEASNPFIISYSTRTSVICN